MTQFKGSSSRSESSRRAIRTGDAVTRRESEVRKAARVVIERREKVLRELEKS